MRHKYHEQKGITGVYQALPGGYGILESST